MTTHWVVQLGNFESTNARSQQYHSDLIFQQEIMWDFIEGFQKVEHCYIYSMLTSNQLLCLYHAELLIESLLIFSL